MTNVLKSERVRKAGLGFYGVFLVLAMFAGGAAAGMLYMGQKGDRQLATLREDLGGAIDGLNARIADDQVAIKDYQSRISAIGESNRELRQLLRQDLPPMRDQMNAHTQQIESLTERIDEVAGVASSAATAASKAATSASRAAKTAGDAGKSVGKAAARVTVATDRVDQVMDKVTDVMTPAPSRPADVPAWLDTP